MTTLFKSEVAALAVAIEQAYRGLTLSMQRAFEAGEAAVEAKALLDAGKTALLMEGRLDGKNEAQREAQARALLASEYARAETAEANARFEKLTLDLARAEVERTRAILRLAELTQVAER